MARAVRAGEVSPEELLDDALRRIAAANPTLNAFLSVSDRAREQARAATRSLARGSAAPLLGVPLAIKDLILTRDARTTAGSRIYGEGLESAVDAPVVRRLRRAGAVIVGRTNLHEIALGVTSENEHFGPVRNPWDPERVPGGSSGGSAVAVAARLVPAAVGTDTRGSIRIPAAACGVTGLKPTFGLVPTEGVIPLSWSLDHVGPLARTVEDAALLLGVMAGGAQRAARYRVAVRAGVRRLRIGVCEYLLRDVDPEMASAVDAALAALLKAGARLSPVSIPRLHQAPEATRIITLAEAATYYAPWRAKHPAGLGRLVRKRLDGAAALTAQDLVAAQRTGLAVADAFRRAFREVDLLAGATIPAFPPRIGAGPVRTAAGDSPALSQLPRLTSAANLGGVPALSVPCGFGAEGLPIGLQLIAARGREDRLIAAGAAYQRASDWHARTPPVPDLTVPVPTSH